jgi:hypothetical protein
MPPAPGTGQGPRSASTWPEDRIRRRRHRSGGPATSPLLVAAVATAAGLDFGYAALGVLTAVLGIVMAAARRTEATPRQPAT